MPRSMDDICTRLRWYLRLCEKYLCINVIVEKADQYIIRYIIIGLRNLVLSNHIIHSDVSNICSRDLLEYLEEVGLQFLYARYSYTDTSSVLSFLKLFCPCLGKIIELRC